MKTNTFTIPISSAVLNETMFKKFGKKINFTKYTREELEDARNHLRTKLSQTESTAGFNDLLADNRYQQDKFMLNLLNTRIKEMLGESARVNEISSDLADRVSKKRKLQSAQSTVKGLSSVHGDEVEQHSKDADRYMSKAKKAARYAQEKNKIVPIRQETSEGIVSEKAVSKKQQRFMGMVNAVKKGKMKAPSAAVAKAAKGMTKKAAHDFAATKLKGLPEKKTDESKMGSMTMKQAKTKSTKLKRIKSKKGIPSADLVSEFYSYDTKKGGQSKPSNDTLGRRPKNGVAAHGDEYKAMRTGTTASGKPYPEHLKKKYGTGGPTGRLPENTIKENYAIILEGIKRFIREDEEGKAKDITAGTDMVNDFTVWMQRVGQYQTKSMIELADSIRANFGQAQSDQFKQTIQPALQQSLDALTQSREIITRAVSALAGGLTDEIPQNMGMSDEEDTMNDSDEMDSDEFAASDAAAGGAETAGREMRESRQQRRARKLSEAHSIISKLAK